MQTLTAMPDTLTAGTTVSYTRAVPDYPATDGWTLTLYLAGKSVLNVAATPSGSDYAVALTAAQTAGLAAGVYTWVERVTKGAEKHDVGRGVVAVLDDPSTATAGSQQSWEEKTLEVVEAALSGQMTSAIASYQIGNRAVAKIPARELWQIRNALKAAVAQQRNPGRFGRPILARFTGTGYDQ